MDVMFYDLILLGIFVISFSIFLFIKRKKIKRDGLLFLYHTKWGVKFIDKFGEKHKKGLRIASYFSIVIGYILMAVMLYLVVEVLWVYIFQASAVRALKVPPITPLIPYLPQIFKLNFLPPFYFSYWIIILAIVTITHEFFHGIFGRAANIKTKTTGFGFFPFFFPIFPAAFVSPDEKQMEKAKNFDQRALLSAGTFANILTTILAGVIMIIFFSLSFAPAGVVYNDYAYGFVNVSSINSINGVAVQNLNYTSFSKLVKSGNDNLIVVGNETFSGFKAATNIPGEIALYYNTPAIRDNLTGAITSIDGIKMTSLNTLSKVVESHSPGDNVTITEYNGSVSTQKEITLGENPDGKAWIGITFVNQNSGIMGFFNAYKDPHVYYKANFSSAEFIYDFLWWLVLISFSVATVNMLPVGIFDGGRFFYLTVLKITKSEKVAERSYKFSTYLFLFILLVLMVLWALAFF